MIELNKEFWTKVKEDYNDPLKGDQLYSFSKVYICSKSVLFSDAWHDNIELKENIIQLANQFIEETNNKIFRTSLFNFFTCLFYDDLIENELRTSMRIEVRNKFIDWCIEQFNKQ